MTGNLPVRYKHKTYLIRKKFFKIFGGAFHIFDPTGGLAFYSKMKAFKLKEDFRLYSDTDMKEELLCIKARQVLDISATYDVTDPKTGDKLGALKRKGLKSLLRDEWSILDGNDHEVGTIKEDSWFLALLRL
ncbi:MAG: hypothetical protein HY897_06140 [Deltaproteobacteria bacterium]|nr:hypothetical protein [Deltaproteobacteria bacterium]